MAKLTNDADYDAGETFKNVPSPLSDAGNHDNYYDRRLRTSTFDHLSKGVEGGFTLEMATDEARACQDLLRQAKYHLNRAKTREEHEREVRQRQEEEKEAQRKRQLELQQQAELLRQQRERRLEEERGKFLEKAKLIVIEPASEVGF
ncbi:unnamed protein product [Protopolystoma xenopodis]|uniref:Uncharacterized protein n=1 Tax=Protopolystoma xenopodis TaxID=117903 RepID=A0A3S5AVK0_9PLAT|nr:unnamed protein product [Protopolystoma xenopodis]